MEIERAPEEVASVVSFRQKKKKREGQFLLNVLTANDRSDRCGKQCLSTCCREHFKQLAIFRNN